MVENVKVVDDVVMDVLLFVLRFYISVFVHCTVNDANSIIIIKCLLINSIFKLISLGLFSPFLLINLLNFYLCFNPHFLILFFSLSFYYPYFDILPFIGLNNSTVMLLVTTTEERSTKLIRSILNF